MEFDLRHAPLPVRTYLDQAEHTISTSSQSNPVCPPDQSVYDTVKDAHYPDEDTTSTRYRVVYVEVSEHATEITPQSPSVRH